MAILMAKYIKLIPFQETPWRPKDQTLFYGQGSPGMGSMWYSHQNCHLSPLSGFKPEYSRWKNGGYPPDFLIYVLVCTDQSIKSMYENKLQQEMKKIFGIFKHLINIYELISVCLSPGYFLVILETAHFSQKSRLKVKAFIYRSTE